MKLISSLLVTLLLFSCGNNASSSVKQCPASGKEAFNLLKENIRQKNLTAAKKLCEYPANYIDTIFKPLANPTVEFIPERADGAFGIKKIASADLYFARIKDGEKTSAIKGVIIQQRGDCYKIVNLSNIDTTR